MRYSILFPILVAVVLTGGATFFITKSVCSNSESQVVAYLKAEKAKKQTEIKKQRETEEEVERRMVEVKKKLLED